MITGSKAFAPCGLLAGLGLLVACGADPAPISSSTANDSKIIIQRTDISAGEVKACVSEIHSRNISKIVNADVQKGQRKFYWAFASEGDLLHPPGIASCPPRDKSTIRLDRVHPFDSEEELPQYAALCRLAIFEYKVKYNWELAANFGDIISKSCEGNSGLIDRNLTLNDGKRYDDLYRH